MNLKKNICWFCLIVYFLVVHQVVNTGVHTLISRGRPGQVSLSALALSVSLLKAMCQRNSHDQRDFHNFFGFLFFLLQFLDFVLNLFIFFTPFGQIHYLLIQFFPPHCH